jgi:hypothetical protein
MKYTHCSSWSGPCHFPHAHSCSSTSSSIAPHHWDYHRPHHISAASPHSTFHRSYRWACAGEVPNSESRWWGRSTSVSCSWQSSSTSSPSRHHDTFGVELSRLGRQPSQFNHKPSR